MRALLWWRGAQAAATPLSPGEPHWRLLGLQRRARRARAGRPRRARGGQAPTSTAARARALREPDTLLLRRGPDALRERRVFDALDADGSGVVSAEEARPLADGGRARALGARARGATVSLAEQRARARAAVLDPPQRARRRTSSRTRRARPRVRRRPARPASRSSSALSARTPPRCARDRGRVARAAGGPHWRPPRGATTLARGARRATARTGPTGGRERDGGGVPEPHERALLARSRRRAPPGRRIVLGTAGSGTRVVNDALEIAGAFMGKLRNCERDHREFIKRVKGVFFNPLNPGGATRRLVHALARLARLRRLAKVPANRTAKLTKNFEGFAQTLVRELRARAPGAAAGHAGRRGALDEQRADRVPQRRLRSSARPQERAARAADDDPVRARRSRRPVKAARSAADAGAATASSSSARADVNACRGRALPRSAPRVPAQREAVPSARPPGARVPAAGHARRPPAETHLRTRLPKAARLKGRAARPAPRPRGRRPPAAPALAGRPPPAAARARGHRRRRRCRRRWRQACGRARRRWGFKEPHAIWFPAVSRRALPARALCSHARRSRHRASTRSSACPCRRRSARRSRRSSARRSRPRPAAAARVAAAEGAKCAAQNVNDTVGHARGQAPASRRGAVRGRDRAHVGGREPRRRRMGAAPARGRAVRCRCASRTCAGAFARSGAIPRAKRTRRAIKELLRAVMAPMPDAELEERAAAAEHWADLDAPRLTAARPRRSPLSTSRRRTRSRSVRKSRCARARRAASDAAGQVLLPGTGRGPGRDARERRSRFRLGLGGAARRACHACRRRARTPRRSIGRALLEVAALVDHRVDHLALRRLRRRAAGRR